MRAIFALLLFICPTILFAQPRYSPEIRAEREAQWMTDTLHITTEQSKQVYSISLNYNQQMDKASQLPAKDKNKTQKHLENKKDATLKKLLNKQQYQKYYKQEKEIRAREKIQIKGPHRPM